MRKKRLSLVRRRKVKITWHYHPDRAQMSAGMRYVYLGRTQYGPHSLIGFDLIYPERCIPFFVESVAIDWAKEQKFKIVSKKRWEKFRAKMLKKKGLT